MVLLEDACNNMCLVLGLGSYAHHAHIPTAGEHDSPAIKPPVATMAPGYLSLTLSLAGAGGYSLEEPVQSCLHGSSTVSNNSYSAAGNQKNVYLATNKLWRDTVGEAKRRSLQGSDEEGVGVRKKLKLTKEQSALLEECFKEHPTLNQMQKHALAKQLNLQARQVEVWFQNRRARTKLKQTEVHHEYLKRCYDSLTHENRRLQRELQELKARRKLSSPLYMPTVTMCPSCGQNKAAIPTDGGTTASAGEAPAKAASGEGPRSGHICGHFATHSSAACSSKVLI